MAKAEAKVVERVIDPSVFLPLGDYEKAEIDYRVNGNKQTRTCRRCGGTETVEAEGKSKPPRFPGFHEFIRAHKSCKGGGSR